jgi:hypothetical protein
MSYKILPYTFKQAKAIGVEVKPSTKKNKKLDVYKAGKLIGSVGAIGYKDYPTYLDEKGKEYADERKRLYKIRHKKDIENVGSNGWLADKLLW